MEKRIIRNEGAVSDLMLAGSKARMQLENRAKKVNRNRRMPMMKIVNAIAITAVIAFALYALGYGNVVDRTVMFVKENAAYAEQHGLGGWVDRIVCGKEGCEGEKK